MNQRTLYQTSFLRDAGIKRILMFCCFLLGIVGSSPSQAQITGPGTVCSGVATLFNLGGTPDPTYTYTWSVIPPGNSTVLSGSGSSGTVQWFNIVPAVETVQVVITRPGLSSVTWQKVVQVVPAPDPQISTNSKVGCQGVKGEKPEKPDGTGGKVTGIIIDDNACMKVCANSTVQYNVLNGQAGSTFQWTIDLAKGNFSGPSTGSTIYVTWSNNLGFTYIKVKETTAAGCVKEKTVCIEIIESPQPKFTVNGDLSPVNGGCFDACTNAVIQFGDLTPNPLSSPLESWLWDFGDGTYSSLQNPQHTYATPGNYTVELSVTNKCGCIGRYKVCINVMDPEKPPLTIECPSIVCENAIGHYTIQNTCPDMFWTVNGGSIVNSTMTSIDIMWDNVGIDGFGEIIADFSNCGGNCGPKVTAQVPVILANGTISGKTVICLGKQYKYQLPKWPATNFKWSVIPASAATIVGFDQNSYEVSIVANSNFTLHCEYVNTMMLCAGKADLNITVVSPMTLSGPAKACLNSSTSIITTVPVAGGTTYTFIDPNGNTSTSGVFDVTGVWTVQASNPAFCEILPISVQVVDPPAAPTSITGENRVCLNTPYVYELVTPMANTICNWSIVPASAGTIITSSGNAITVRWNTLGAKTLVVSRTWADLPGCNSAAASIVVNDATPVVSLSGNITPCANTSGTYTATLGAGTTIDNIVWSIAPQTAGSVSAGQNTLTPTLTWNNTTAATTAVTVIAVVTKCGISTTVNYGVTVIGIPSINSITPSNPTPCSGTPVTFTASTTPPGATVTWSTPGGVPSSGSATTTYTNLGLASQNFTVTATASMAGCLLTGTGSTTIAVKPQPNINVSPGSGTSSSITICPPTTVNFLLSTNATTSINWYYNPPSAPFATGTTAPPAVSAAGTYRVDVSNSFGCSSSVTRFINHSCDPPCTLPPGAGVSSKSHAITSCANSAGEAKVNVNFNGIYGTYPSSGPYVPGNITSLSVNGNGAYITLPTPVIGFPNVSLTGVSVTKPGIYPVTLVICYQTPSGAPCCMPVTENVIVPVIADFDYVTNCAGSGYTLTLNDQSPILSGYGVTGQTWTINGGSVSPVGINLNLYTPGSTLTIVHTITVNGPAGTFTCSRTRLYTVPTVPVPAFSITSTDPTNTGLNTCAKREVLFSSLNNTGVTRWTWNFGDLPTNTGFVSVNNGNAARTYDNPASTYSTNVTLTLTDAFGCNFSTSKPLNVYRNTFVLNTTNTYNLPEDIKCQGTASSVTLIGVTGGYGGNSYAWYNEEVFMPAYTTNPINVTLDGLYWTRVTDLHGCQQPGNPTPAKRAFQPLPDVAITGNHDFCPNQSFTLSAANGTTTGITYQWQQLIGASWVNIPYTTAVITIPGQPVGVYQYRVIATQTLPSPYTGSCANTSPGFTITVHGIPNYPAISGPFAVNCANYSIQLNVASPQPGVVYNWSNGNAGTSTIVNHGGAYRVWATNAWGCTNLADIDVPMEPSSYFWRFPHGCYNFCRTELPRRVDGPSYIVFPKWEWLLWNSTLPFPNGVWAGGGSYSTVSPLNINLDPSMGGDGNGPGDYSWYLDNGLCAETSHTMNVQMNPDCCELDARLDYFRCEWLPGAKFPTYYGGISVYGTSDCKTATYTIYALDPVTGLPNGTVMPASGVYTPGMVINFAYTPLPGVNSVKFQVEISCDGKKCIAAHMEEVKDLKRYPCRDMEHCDVDRKWEYFNCVWPKGAPSSYFIGKVSFNNPLGCDPTTYTIYAVDPGTGLPNGTVSPASGSVPGGWVTTNFSYTPNPGVTKVKFIIVFTCGDHVCWADLGEFDDLTNKDRYPCKDFSKLAFSSGDQGPKMLIAPNPANNDVKISYDIPAWKQSDLYQIAIVNLLGQSVAQYIVTGAQGAWQYGTLQITSGTYLVRLIKDGKNIDVQRMIIAH